jgi:hypothetical protein
LAVALADKLSRGGNDDESMAKSRTREKFLAEMKKAAL